VTRKCTVSWDVTPCSLEIARRFGGTCRLHLQGRRVNEARNQQDQAASWAELCWFLAWPALRPWRWRRNVPQKRRAVSELHGVTTQETVLFSVCLCFVFLNSSHVKRKIRRKPVDFPFQKKLEVDDWGPNTYICSTYVSVKCWVNKWRAHCTGTLRDAPRKWLSYSWTRRGRHEVWFSLSDGEAEERLRREPRVLVCCSVVTWYCPLSKLA
jgi:hypothetical protein